jgi:hypothetical protein
MRKSITILLLLVGVGMGAAGCARVRVRTEVLRDMMISSGSTNPQPAKPVGNQ